MNKFIEIIRLTFLLTTLALISQVKAAEFSIGTDGYGIAIEGEIKPGDFSRFNKFIIANAKNVNIHYDKVELNSPGGSVEEALLFASLFSENLSLVIVNSGGGCFSACTIMWAGGAERLLLGNAKLGFHRLSFTKEEVDVRRLKAKTDPENQKVTAFFQKVGFPSILIDKMNETAPTDIYMVDEHWLIDHELERAVMYQPVYFDVIERQCGIDPSIEPIKQSRRMIMGERENYKSWLNCTNEVKEKNRKLVLNDMLRKGSEDKEFNSRLKNVVANTKWTQVGKTDDGDTIYVDKQSAKWNGRVVKQWTIINTKDQSNEFSSSLDYRTIDCNRGTTASIDGSFTLCNGKMCASPFSTVPNQPSKAKKPPTDSLNGILINTVCNSK